MKELYFILGLFFVLLTAFIIVVISETASAGSTSSIRKYPFTSTGPLRFHLVGDWGDLRKSTKKEDNGTLPVTYVADAMRIQASKKPISMVISVGDNIYEKPKGKFDERFYTLMFKDFDYGSIAMKPWYLVLGNHDCYSGVDDELDMDELFPMWNMPSAYYNKTFPLGGQNVAGFAFLNGCEVACEDWKSYKGVDECGDMSFNPTNKSITEEYNWLEGVLKDWSMNPDMVWRVVVVHQGMFSISNWHGDNEAMKKRLFPLLQKYSVDAMMSGHDHSMQYYYIKHDAQFIPGNYSDSTCGSTTSYTLGGKTSYSFKKGDIHEFLMGASGAEIGEICPGRTTQMADLLYANSTYGFADVYMDPYTFKVSYLNAHDASRLFEVTIQA